MIFSFCVKALGAALLRTIKVRRAPPSQAMGGVPDAQGALRNSMVL
jgi:hypothetical protein